jgi:hypothetical protein
MLYSTNESVVQMQLGTHCRHTHGMESAGCRAWIQGNNSMGPPGSGAALLAAARRLKQQMYPCLVRLYRYHTQWVNAAEGALLWRCTVGFLNFMLHFLVLDSLLCRGGLMPLAERL